MNRCRRCGNILEKKSDLWCDYCRKRVDEELEGKADRDFKYYFRWNLRHKK